MKAFRKILATSLSASLAVMMMVTSGTPASAESSTGVGLAAHALKAYREEWSYVWGGTSDGAVDCSGLIASYNGVGGMRTDMLASSSEWGYVSEGVPRVHGLGLHHPGHIGVYIGSGMAVDARDEYWGVVYHNVYSKNWVEWFKVAGVSYPENGWVLLDGDSYYYENGQYVVSTQRTIDGVTYSFDGSGVSDMAPPPGSYNATDYSTANAMVAKLEPKSEPKPEPKPEPEPEPEEESSEEPVEESSEEPVEESSEEPEEISEQPEESSEEPEEVSEDPEESSEEAEEVSEQPQDSAQTEENSTEDGTESASTGGENSDVSGTDAESGDDKSAEEKEESSKVPEEVKILAEYDTYDTEDNAYIADTEKELYRLGYVTEKPDGYFDAALVDAVMIYQNSNDLDVTGRVDEKTYELIKSGKGISAYEGISSGSENDDVSRLQSRLAELKYFYEEDKTGFYGEITEFAVKQFQRDNGLEESGAADENTLKAIYDLGAKENPNAGTLYYSQSGSAVTKMQTRLIELRFMSGKPTGTFDDATLAAVHEYRKTAGLDDADLMTADELDALYSEDAVKSPEYDTMKYGQSGDDVTTLQADLAQLKYYDGKSTGTYEKDLQESVIQFQKDNGLEVTGDADDKTKQAIKTEQSREKSESGEELIMKSATIADDAFAGLADSRAVQRTVEEKTQNDMSRTILYVIIGAILVLLLAISIVIIKKRSNSKGVTVVRYDNRKF